MTMVDGEAISFLTVVKLKLVEGINHLQGSDQQVRTGFVDHRWMIVEMLMTMSKFDPTRPIQVGFVLRLAD